MSVAGIMGTESVLATIRRDPARDGSYNPLPPDHSRERQETIWPARRLSRLGYGLGVLRRWSPLAQRRAYIGIEVQASYAPRRRVVRRLNLSNGALSVRRTAADLSVGTVFYMPPFKGAMLQQVSTLCTPGSATRILCAPTVRPCLTQYTAGLPASIGHQLAKGPLAVFHSNPT